MGKWKVKPRSKKNALEETKAKKKAAALKSTPPVWPTKSGFKRWLSQMDNRIVGKTGIPTKCALANYTKTLNPKAKVVRFGHNGIDYSPESRTCAIDHHVRELADWMDGFMFRFDFHKKDGTPIKGTDALQCLG